MRRWMTILLLVVMLFLSACNTSNAQIVQPTSKVYSTLTSSVFNYEYFRNLFHFSLIMFQLSHVKNKDDMTYVRGMIYSYLITYPVFVTPAENTNGNEKKHPTDSPYKEDVFNLQQNESAYLEGIQRLLDNGDLSAIQSKQDEFTQLYNLVLKINDDRRINKRDLPSYMEQVKQMNSMLRQKISAMSSK